MLYTSHSRAFMNALGLTIEWLPVALQAWIFVIFLRKQLYRRFPVFFVYTLCQIATGLVRGSSLGSRNYFYVYWWSAAIIAILSFLSLHESFRSIFSLRPQPGRVRWMWRFAAEFNSASSRSSGSQNRNRFAPRRNDRKTDHYTLDVSGGPILARITGNTEVFRTRSPLLVRSPLVDSFRLADDTRKPEAESCPVQEWLHGCELHGWSPSSTPADW